MRRETTDDTMILIAYEFGRNAFRKGIKAPALDKAFLDSMIAGLRVGEGIPLLTAWLKGWTIENLRAPIA